MKGTKPSKRFKSALPFASVHTEAQAKSLFIRFAKLAYDNRTYTVAGWSGWHGELEDMDALGQMFEAEIVARKWV